VLVLTVLLAACGGGGGGDGGKPAASQGPATSAPPAVTPGAQRLRDVVTRTLDKCPCEISVGTTLFGEKRSFTDVKLVGYYDPRTRSAALREQTDPTSMVRIVDGRMFLSTKELRSAGREWVLLDFSGVPASPKKNVASLFAGMDPSYGMALGRSVLEDRETVNGPRGEIVDVVYDADAARKLTGGGGELFGRLVTRANSIGEVVVKGGALVEVSYNVLGPGATVDAVAPIRIEVRRTGVKAQRVAAPSTAGTLDVTKL
jgi:hypothetical protein